MFGFWEVLLILGLLVLIFGARKIPALARGLGEGIRNFKGAVEDGSDDEEPPRVGGGDQGS